MFTATVLRKKNFLIFLLAFLCSCKSISTKIKRESSFEDRKKTYALFQEEDIKIRKKIHPIELDEIEFRVNGVRVNSQIFLKYSSPVVSFQLPNKADYVDIMRCPENVMIVGGNDSLDNVEFRSKDSQEETRIFQRNNFWQMMSEAQGCVLVASSFSNLALFDPTAKSGNYYYYVRACVDSDRIETAKGFSNYNCSRFITRSNKISHTNSRTKSELESMVKAKETRDEIYTLGRTLEKLTEALKLKYNSCALNDPNLASAKEVSTQKDEILQTAGIVAGTVGGLGALAILGSKVPVIKNSPINSKKMTNIGAGAVVASGLGFMVAMMATTSTPKQITKYAEKQKTCEGSHKTIEEITKDLSDDSDNLNLNACSCAEVLKIQEMRKTLVLRINDLKDLYDNYTGLSSSEDKSDASLEETK